MAIVNTLNLLPEVFRSDTNQRFLGATLDHLATDAVNVPINGYIGRTFAPTYKLGDNYVPEESAVRSQYQLEPSVVVKDDKNNITFNSTYIDLLQSIENSGGFSKNQNRLFSGASYNYDGRFDYDKFVNYNNYYWMPDGPDSVEVSAGATPYQADYVVSRDTANGGYTFSGLGSHPNTQVTLVRGGTYTFIVDQPGYKFWIQSNPGVSGIDPNISTVSTREVFGVKNNGVEKGVIQFKVPLVTAQNFYTAMPINSIVNAAVTFDYTKIQNRLLSDFITEFPDGLDGVNNLLQNKTFVFVGGQIDDTQWTTPALPTGFSGTSTSAITPGSVIASANRNSVWQINLVASGPDDYLIQIRNTIAINPQEKVFIGSGKTYASSQFWLNNNYKFVLVPVITATSDYLFYQDSDNPEFVGQIKLVDNKSVPIDADNDIIGKSSYTSPNGIIFTNGLKIKFDGLVTPSNYVNATVDAGDFVPGNIYKILVPGETDFTAIGASSNEVGTIFVATGVGSGNGTATTNREFYVQGVGTSIQLVPVEQLVVPAGFSTIINEQADYITINRGSIDRNPWSRTNRWFHKDVLQATATYNQTVIDYGPNLPGRRAIIEFEPNLQLLNYGIQSKNNIDVIIGVDPGESTSDAFVDIEGQTNYTLDGVELAPGMRVVFANDYDTNIKNQVWLVDFELINAKNFIRLIPTVDDPVVPGEQVLVTQGSHAGKTYRYTGTAWLECQNKTEFNQAPLFDLVDADGYSFSDTTVYPGSTFAGTEFFGYAEGTGNYDAILTNLKLKYQNFNNIGDIVFQNCYDTDSFTYTGAGTQVTKKFNSGYLKKNLNLTDSVKLNNWVDSIKPSGQYQIITQFYEGYTLAIGGVDYAFVQIDVLPEASDTVPRIKVYLNNTLLNNNTDYSIKAYGIYHVVALTNTPVLGDKIDILIFSKDTSNIGYYEVPDNLDYNTLNQDFLTITLGQIRSHYNKLIENTSVSANTSIPLRDRYIKRQGGTLLQQSSPVVYSMAFLNDPDVNFINAITLARKEYTRFKNKFLSLCTSLPGLSYNNPMADVDLILQNINAVKNISFPWYYSDMVPQGGNFSTINYTVINARQTAYEISSIFDITQLSNRAILVYHNGIQLTLDEDYTFNPISPQIVFSIQLAVGDTILIRDYNNTDGNYIPETPSKLGLYPKFAPAMYVDSTYRTPTTVIRGHDGSITPAFGDFRDQYLLELENRIFNNIKADYNTNNIDIYDVTPGRYRTTEYSLLEWNQLLTKNFLQWVGSNNIDYTTNSWYDVNDSWTWNYEKFTDTATGAYLQGNWRAIYEFWYDTDTPHLTPWKMLGIGSMPSWWETRYGPAPYTGSNDTLWQDVEAGYIWNDGAPYYDDRFARVIKDASGRRIAGVTDVIPVDSAGNLLPPTSINIIKSMNAANAGNSFQVGQQGPVETAWRRSSDYPYAIQSALALSKPAQYFASQLDTSRFYVNPVTGHFSTVDNQKISPSLITINGDATTIPGTVLRASGYMNWIADSIKNVGIDPISKLNNYFKNFSVQLAHKVAGFTDQNLIVVNAEQTSPGSSNASVIIPDQNYYVHLGKPNPVKIITYSGVIITKTAAGGYSLSGYDTANPFFTIFPSVPNNNTTTVSVGSLTAKIYQSGKDTPVVLPYGTTFSNIQQVVDFLISYERHLVSQGFKFTYFDSDLQTVRDWSLSVKEFLFWAQQGWAAGTILVLNPIFDKLILTSSGAVVDEITNFPGGSRLLDTNFKPVKSNSFNILRLDNPAENSFILSTIDGITPIAFAQLQLVQFENVLIFDNIDNFGDIIYIPNQGTRQFRLKISGAKTGAWNGSLSPAGYIYSNPKIDEWQPGVDYRQGDLVTFNNVYYTAALDVSASQTFSSSSWTRIALSDIQTGLLPSFGHNAQIFTNIYDVDNPPQDENYQLFSAGLLGFRERPFLSNLGISIPTQTKFYQGYIKQKGTTNAINALTKATFDNINSTVNTYEEWAFQVGTYGDVNSTQYTELVLDQSVFLTNPVAVKLITGNTYAKSNNIVNVGITSNLFYNSGNLSSVSTQLYSNRTGTYNTDLPTAGFVNVNDVEYQTFDISVLATMPRVNVGEKLWTAKDIKSGWNVYRVSSVAPTTAISLTYTLDSYAQLAFNNPHSLAAGDFFVLQDLNSKFDGVYQVVTAQNNFNITIKLQNPADLIKSNSKIVGKGTIYKLVSMVIGSVYDIDTITPIDKWTDNDRVWVNNATNDGWGVYTYNRPWHANADAKIVANTITANSYFGNAVRISNDQYIYIGAPGAKQVKILSVANTASNITLSNVNTGFGYTITSTGNLVAIGSSANVHVYTHNNSITPTKIQTITSSNLANVSSISISSDQHWLYVGDSVNNIVEAFYTANISATPFVWKAKITSPVAASQFGAQVKTNSSGNVVIIGAPRADNVVTDSGNVYLYKQLTANVFTNTQTIISNSKAATAYFGTAIDIDSTGGNLFVSSPGYSVADNSTGLVERFIYSGGQYVANVSLGYQSFKHPFQEPGTFGSSMRVSSDGSILAVGSASDNTVAYTTFDNATLTTDQNSTQYIELIPAAGSVHIFEPLVDLTLVNDAGRYSYAQELIAQVNSGDDFGRSIDIGSTGILVGAPGANLNSGNAHVFANGTTSKAWTLTRQQTSKVDISSISRTFIYDKSNNIITAGIDFIDPAKGKILNSVGVDIDFQLVEDPALYNKGAGDLHPDYHWGPNQVGKIWWNLDAVRYIDYEQDSLSYRMAQWGQPFPGSAILVYEWVESSVPPSQYVANGGNGIPRYQDDSAYSTYGYVTQTGAVNVRYYFWVTGKTTVNELAGKNNSVYSITAAIVNPQSQGIPYATVLQDDTLAIYNVNNKLTGKNSILHLGGHKSNVYGLVHSEYALVQEGNPQSQLPDSIKIKLIDSLAGQDSVGNPVPDPLLSPAQAYGVNIRPRQSMFINAPLALSNYVTLVNSYLLTYPVVERKLLTTLNKSELEPNLKSQEYSFKVSTYAELTYIQTEDTAGNLIVPYTTSGTRVLVGTDETNNSRWAIYEWNASTRQWAVPLRTSGKPWIQSYKTNLYWNYIDWYDSNYDYTVAPDVTVSSPLDFGKLELQPDTHVKILNNGNDQFVVYYIDATLNQTLVGIQNGTIQINTGTIPPAEMRQIALAIQNDILIEDLADKFNKVFFTMIKYALTEQKNLDWVFKTSFISATQYIRQLEQFPSYIADNQNFYESYINEVKPYRSVLREFVVDYQGNDQYVGDMTDFDLPPYWDRSAQIYRSPNGSQSYDANLLTSSLYSQWNDNYKYSVVDVLVETPGTGYTFPPEVTIVGGNGKGAKAYAELDFNGGIDKITITNPGSGYTTIPTININGVGSGAQAIAILRNVWTKDEVNEVSGIKGHNVVRSISTTVKFDRVGYTAANTFVFWANISSTDVGNTVIAANSILVATNKDFYKVTVTDWRSNTAYSNGSLIYYYNPITSSGNTYTVNGNAYGMNFGNVSSNLVLNTTNTRAYTVSTVDFPLSILTPVAAKDLDNANDRIVGYNGNIDLSLTQLGLDYPGVIVGNTQANSYRSEEFDSTIQSFYGNVFGVNPGDINIDGGAYVSNFSSHAPEELIPGRMFDSLNMQVFDTNQLAFRIFEDMSTTPVYQNGQLTKVKKHDGYTFYRIASANTTVLTSNLSLGNTSIVVDNAAKLPAPDLIWNKPGVVFVNGEKITYWRNYALETQVPWTANAIIPTSTLISYSGNTYITLGNVFGSTFAGITSNVTRVSVNTLAQIRRAVDGTAPASIYPIGTRVVDASYQQQVPGSNYSNITLATDKIYQTTDAVSFGVRLTGNITANIGDILTQTQSVDTWTSNTTITVGQLTYYSGNTYTVTGNVNSPTFSAISANVAFAFSGNTVTTLQMRLLQTVANVRVVPVIITSGSVSGLPDLFDSGVNTGDPGTYDNLNFDNTAGKVSVNGTSANVYIISAYTLGSVSGSGNVTMPAGTDLHYGNVWYSPGVGTPSNDLGLINSTTEQANFLKASKGYTP